MLMTLCQSNNNSNVWKLENSSCSGIAKQLILFSIMYLKEGTRKVVRNPYSFSPDMVRTKVITLADSILLVVDFLLLKLVISY